MAQSAATAQTKGDRILVLNKNGRPSLRRSLCAPRLYLTWYVMTLVLTLTVSAGADQPSLDSSAPVRFKGETLFVIHTGLASIDPAARAAAIEKRLERLAHSNPSVIEGLTIEDHEETSYVVTREEVLFVVTEQEAKLVGKPRYLLAQERVEHIQQAFRAIAPPPLETEPLLSASIHLRDLLWAGLATALLIFLAVAAHVGFPLLYEFIDTWHETRLRPLSFEDLNSSPPTIWWIRFYF